MFIRFYYCIILFSVCFSCQNDSDKNVGQDYYLTLDEWVIIQNTLNEIVPFRQPERDSLTVKDFLLVCDSQDLEYYYLDTTVLLQKKFIEINTEVATDSFFNTVPSDFKRMSRMKLDSLNKETSNSSEFWELLKSNYSIDGILYITKPIFSSDLTESFFCFGIMSSPKSGGLYKIWLSKSSGEWETTKIESGIEM